MAKFYASRPSRKPQMRKKIRFNFRPNNYSGKKRKVGHELPKKLVKKTLKKQMIQEEASAKDVPMVPEDLITMKDVYSEHKYFFDSLLREDLHRRILKSSKFQYGNFDKFYSLNRKDMANVRSRLQVLSQEWFCDKKILDIGCNDGTFTLALTLDYAPKLVIGVDIDNKLVSRAIRNTHKMTNDLITKSIIDNFETTCDFSGTNKDSQETNEEEKKEESTEEKPENPIETKDQAEKDKGEIVEEAKEKYDDRLESKAQSEIDKSDSKSIPTDKSKIASDLDEKLSPKEFEGKDQNSSKSEISPQNMTLQKDAKKEGISQEEILTNIKNLPKCLRISLSVPSVVKSISTREALTSRITKETKDFLYKRLFFRCENFIANLEPTSEKFDVILCLKTSKWIHLNFGDAGLKALFHKVFESLAAGGLFIYDPSTWKGYRKRKSMGENLKANFESIDFKPDEFDEYLTQKVGFIFKKALKSSSKEYHRPLLVYAKPE
ncbi:unnamed protein product [Moneuplotes crassus]|uniref:RNA methyltransferase n=1 Tax=Euplotes crassus TaxID=5936 RepID=A0AAD1U7A7_EUPCR|nr:unnamed protein product [Moneuplotes crassus]